jgi:hypothetical protein
MKQNNITNNFKDLNSVNRLNLYYQLNEVPHLLGISDKTSRRLVPLVKKDDEIKVNRLINKTNGVWSIHFSLLDNFLDKLTYKLNKNKQTSISTPWQSFLTVNIKGGYTKSYYLMLFKILREQIKICYGEHDFLPAIEPNPSNNYYHFHLLSTLNSEDMLNITNKVLNGFLGDGTMSNNFGEYKCHCEKPISNTKLVHYLSKCNTITDDEFEHELNMSPPIKLRMWS